MRRPMWRAALCLAAFLALPVLAAASASSTVWDVRADVRAETAGGTSRIDAIANVPEARVVGRSERRLTASARDTVAVLTSSIALLALVLIGRAVASLISAVQKRGLRVATARGPPAVAVLSFA